MRRRPESSIMPRAILRSATSRERNGAWLAARELRTLCTRDLTRKPRSSDWAEALIAVPHVVHHKVRRRDARCCSRRTAFPTSRTSLSFDAQLPTAARRQPDVVSNPDVVMRTTP
jgi:hypothetical protein